MSYLAAVFCDFINPTTLAMEYHYYHHLNVWCFVFLCLFASLNGSFRSLKHFLSDRFNVFVLPITLIVNFSAYCHKHHLLETYSEINSIPWLIVQFLLFSIPPVVAAFLVCKYKDKISWFLGSLFSFFFLDFFTRVLKKDERQILLIKIKEGIANCDSDT